MNFPAKPSILFVWAIILTLVVASILPCAVRAQTAETATNTEKEKQAGWQLLFNGKDLKGWHSYMQNKPGRAWQVQNGMIFLNKNKQKALSFINLGQELMYLKTYMIFYF